MNDNQWIYFLKLTPTLSSDYLVLDRKFKSFGKSLVPIGLKNLLCSVPSTGYVNIFIVIKNVEEFRFYQKRVVKILKYLLRTEKVRVYIASSFSNDVDFHLIKKDQYNYIKIPVSFEYLCGSISKSIDLSRNKGHARWPGGIRSTFELVG